MKIILDVTDIGSDAVVPLLTDWARDLKVYSRHPGKDGKPVAGKAVRIRSVLIETTPAEDAALPAHLDSIKRSQAFREQ
jgi:hypothetical protein